jgi:multiple antibiotic resistance protein
MDAVDLGVNLFVALFALVDPIGNIPIFAAATAGASMRQRLSVSGLICIFIVVFLAFFFFTGLGLLQFFGISLAAFRIAGGILLLLLGLDMTREDFLKMFADPEAIKDAQSEQGYARRRFQRLIVPFAMPLMIGPGAISTIIIQAGEAEKVGPAGQIAGMVAILAAGLATFICFTLTGPISRRDRHVHCRPGAGPDPLRPGHPVHPRRPVGSHSGDVQQYCDDALSGPRALDRSSAESARVERFITASTTRPRRVRQLNRTTARAAPTGPGVDQIRFSRFACPPTMRSATRSGRCLARPASRLFITPGVTFGRLASQAS